MADAVVLDLVDSEDDTLEDESITVPDTRRSMLTISPQSRRGLVAYTEIHRRFSRYICRQPVNVSES